MGRSKTVALCRTLLLSFAVLAGCGGGGGGGDSAPPAGNPPTVPAAPTGVVATPGDGAITLTWSAASGATSYNIYWSTTAGVSKVTGTKIASASSPYAHTGLTNGIPVYYVVAAANSAGESPVSAEVSATPAAAPPPAAPTNVTAVPGDGQVTIAWSPVSGATSYNLYWSTTAGVTTATGTQIADVVSPYTHTGLTNGTPYYCVVTAVGGSVESGESAEANATPAAPGSSLRVRVVNTVNEKGVVLEGATVVLGDSTGALVDTGVTDANGEVTFGNPPPNAMVTAAIVKDVTASQYSLETLVDVNVPAVTISLEKTSPIAGTANVSVTNTLGADHWVVFPGRQVGIGSATATVSVRQSVFQDDGNVSFVVLGYDASHNLIGYGMVLDQSFVTGMNVSVNLDQPFTDHVTATLTNMPTGASGIAAAANIQLTRDGGLEVGDIETGALLAPVPASTTLTIPVFGGYGDRFEYETTLDVDGDGDGIADFTYAWGKWDSSAGNYSVDFSAFPLIPSNLQITGSDPARPTLSWSGNDVSAHSIMVWLNYVTVSGGLHEYGFYVPPGRTSVTFPELPDSLAAFRPTAALTSLELNLQNDKCSLPPGYDGLLTFIDQYHGGTQSIFGLSCIESGISY